ncbi:MAG TPA: hypothetical protein VFT84_12175 [Gemmatimonadales bacterium]|jgi:hypothetical protein|nr:hypothetical protein [Gemmatimonadales bacterium]
MAASVQTELTRMRMILQELEDRLEAGEVPPEGLPEFKSTVDEIRLRVWALLSAAGADAPRATAERFRLRRAAEFCRSLTQELAAGHLGAEHAEWPELQQMATQLSAAIARHTGQAA